VQYYRCLGSDRYRHLRGPVCQCRPIRQDYLDELVWEQVVGLLKAPELVRAEIDRRMEESLSSDPMQQRKIRLERELKRTGSQLDKLLDAYQEGSDWIGRFEKPSSGIKAQTSRHRKGTGRSRFANPGENPTDAAKSLDGKLLGCFAAIGKDFGNC